MMATGWRSCDQGVENSRRRWEAPVDSHLLRDCRSNPGNTPGWAGLPSGLRLENLARLDLAMEAAAETLPALV
jgi:hypothetical protein